MTILRGNLGQALSLAIADQEKREKALGFDPGQQSAFLAGLRQALEAIQQGKRIEVK